MAADLKRRGLLALFCALLISACTSTPVGEGQAEWAEPDYARVFLVRHAEKEKGDDPALTADDLINIVPGPDFPTGGVIAQPSSPIARALIAAVPRLHPERPR